MHILLCNERFLFRYGVDRVLLIMADYIRKQGDTVSIMGLNIDETVAKNVADNVIKIPSHDDYYNLNEHVDNWLKENWDETFEEIGTPDLVLNCGWPFFMCIPFMKSKTKAVIFHDYGIVPIYQYEGGTLKIQEKVRSLRKQYMRYCSYVITISDYCTKTTYEIKPEYNIPVKTIHLGVNHMEMNLWNADEVKTTSTSEVQRLIVGLREQNKRIILNLGRWENHGYKNSNIMYDILREIKTRVPNVTLLTLAQPGDMAIPEDLKENIYPLGFVSDEDLQFAMQESDLGIAPTLWEGFNLPLAEMQYCEKPVLVFNIGAHPEVVIHPWYLCDNRQEMVEKAVMCVEGRDLKPYIKKRAYKRFKEYFTWEKSTKKCYEVFEYVLNGCNEDVPLDNEYVANAMKQEMVIMDMTNPSRDPANPGIIRVCRRLAAELQYFIDPIFVIWSEPDKAYVMPTLHECQIMGTYNGPILFDSMRLSPDDHRITLLEYLQNRTPKKNRWMFLPDIIFMDKGYDVRKYCKENNFMMAEIFYDDIPYKLRDIYSQERQDAHAKYMIRLADSELVSSISQYSTDCIHAFYKEVGITNDNVITLEIPGEFNSTERATARQIPEEETVQFMCVSTLEPRKNHRVLIDAALKLENEHPDLNFKLVLIGNKYPGHFDIAEYAEEVSSKSKHIEYLGVVSDDVMKEEQRKSTFTVYPSRMEGYGMPIMESIWQGIPCLCSSEGAMGELAAGGGCYTTDINNVDSVYAALYELCTDRELIGRLTREALTRNIITWEQYAESTLRAFVMERNKYNGLQMPDRKYICCQREKLTNELYMLSAMVDEEKPDVIIAKGICAEAIHVLDKYDRLIFAVGCSGLDKSSNVVSVIEQLDIESAVKEGIGDYTLCKVSVVDCIQGEYKVSTLER